MCLLSLLVSPGPNQPKEMNNLEQSLPPNMWHQCAFGPLLLTSPLHTLLTFIQYLCQSFTASFHLLKCFLLAAHSYSHPFLHLEWQKAQRTADSPFCSSHCSWPQGAEAALQSCLWLLWLSYSDYKLQKYAVTGLSSLEAVLQSAFQLNPHCNWKIFSAVVALFSLLF